MKTYSREPVSKTRENVVCPLCGSERRKNKYTCEGFGFDKCLDCGMIYQNPRPSEKTVLSLYDGEYFKYEKREEEQFLELMLKGLDDVDFFSFSAGRENEGFLDVGCATGILLGCLKDRGYAVKGLEVCRESAEYGIKKRAIEIEISSLENSSFMAESFFFIHCSHVIEHLTDPEAFVRKVFTLLKPGGYFLVATPDASGFQAVLYKNRWRSCIADHMVLFTKKVLKRLLQKEGFAVKKIRTWGGLAVGAGHPRLKKILDPAAKKLGFGDVVMMAARKPW